MSPVLGALGVGARAFGLTASTGAATSYDLLTTALISSNTAAVTFDTSTYSAYKHLQVRYTARSSSADGVFKMNAFNSDSGANYTFHRLKREGTGVTSGTVSGQTFFWAGNLPDATMTAGLFGNGIIDILDFASANKNTTVRMFYGDTGNAIVGLNSGVWLNTAALTTFSLTSYSNFVAGSRFSLYGIKG